MNTRERWQISTLTTRTLPFGASKNVRVRVVGLMCAAVSMLPSREMVPTSSGIASSVANWPARGPERLVSK